VPIKFLFPASEVLFMPPIKRAIPKRRLVVDVGTGSGEFLKVLKAKSPGMKVIGFDREPGSKAVIKRNIAEFAMDLKHPERIHTLWFNHVDIISNYAFQEFSMLVKKLTPGTKLIFTMRKERSEQVKTACKLLGLKPVTEVPFDPARMIGSPHSMKFYDESTTNSQRSPQRIIFVKE